MMLEKEWINKKRKYRNKDFYENIEIKIFTKNLIPDWYMNKSN